MSKIAIIVGSNSDLEQLEVAFKYCDYFGIAYESKVLSAHRNYAALSEYIRTAEKSGVEIFIGCAGMAAHLPGIIAAQTTKPVIGVPLEASGLHGLDALLSIVQMPSGVPVATVAIGKAGIINAVILSARILSLHDENIASRLQEFAKIGCKLT